MTYALIRPSRRPNERANLEAFARVTGMHPDLVIRLVALGVVNAERDRAGELWFSPEEAGALARVQRLRAGFALNYAAVGLVTDLLDRIAVLQTALRDSQRSGG